jgi:predicted transcriptional regulator
MSVEHQLSGLQLAVMRELWQRGEATVAEVHEALQATRGLAVTTIATVLSRLEKRGLVGHRREKRQYVYHPTVSGDEVQRSMLTELTERVFDGDVTALVSQLLTDQELEPGDLSRVKAMIEAREQEIAREDGSDDAQ